MLTPLLDLIFPKKSLSGTEGTWITQTEIRKIENSLVPVLLTKDYLEERGTKYLDALVAAGSYGDSPLLRKAVHLFKYRRVKGLAPYLAEWMVDAIPGLLISPATELPLAPVLCPVPLHWTRRFSRGFNQAELLAADISAQKDWPVMHLLTRVRPTGHQMQRNREERLTALDGAFKTTETPVVPAWVILIDDVCTTGSTLSECAKELRMAGVQWISALVIAND